MKWLWLFFLSAVSFAQVSPPVLTVSEFNDQAQPLGADLAWSAVLPNTSVGHYGIYRLRAFQNNRGCPAFGTNWIEFADVPATQLTYLDFTQLPPSGPPNAQGQKAQRGYWCYAVTTTDDTGNESGPSNFGVVYMGSSGYLILHALASDCTTSQNFPATAGATASITVYRNGNSFQLPIYEVLNSAGVVSVLEFEWANSYQYHDGDIVVAMIQWPDGDQQSVQLYSTDSVLPPIQAFYEYYTFYKVPSAGGQQCSGYRSDAYQTVTQ